VATLTRALETLQGRRSGGERPVVSVGGADYEFAGVMFGGSSPLVWLIDPQGTRVAKTAADWSRLGVSFRGRSRDLGKAKIKQARSLEQEIREIAAGAGLGVDADVFDLRRFAIDVSAELPYVGDESRSPILARGRVGQKVFVSALWRMLRTHPRIGEMTEREFKRRLYEAHRARLIELARADFVQAMDPSEVAASEIAADGAQFHFVWDR
jgi:hypothetical protein